jgi:hypothetical protein
MVRKLPFCKSAPAMNVGKRAMPRPLTVASRRYRKLLDIAADESNVGK